MFEIGPEKLLVILAAMLIFLGPKELPAAARKLGAGMRQLRSLQGSLHDEITQMIDADAGEHDSRPVPRVSGSATAETARREDSREDNDFTGPTGSFL